MEETHMHAASAWTSNDGPISVSCRVHLHIWPTAIVGSQKKENLTPIGSKIAELSESRSELLTRIQGLKQDLQSWRSKLDTQVKIYRDVGDSFFAVIELSELKKSLNVEVEQLRSEFQELRTTLQQQQDDVSTSLRNLGLQDQDVSEDANGTQNPKVEGNTEEDQAPPIENGKEIQQ
ncbi:hypothetical protein HHK36_022946 [Tetracentron sinense]|uniref:Uncharacterized protein n=1 Tax=Tetracentron sinense TaxID=13715 RepID=A0A834YQX1_TETSI|nr:hypothetical protein HHK36_022946 [Tetracentron sinense]